MTSESRVIAVNYFPLVLNFEPLGERSVSFQTRPAFDVIIKGDPPTYAEVVECLSGSGLTALLPLMAIEVIMAAIGAAVRVQKLEEQQIPF